MAASHDAESKITRRELLGGMAVAAFSGVSLRAGAQFGRQPRGPYGPFRMGIQSYSLRAFDFDQALEMTRKLGLRYWESFQAHIPPTDDPMKVRETLEKLKAQRIGLWAWGVQSFGGNEENARRLFEFAKAMKLRVITADPSREALPILDRLVQQYKINIAIHNHGPGSRYDKIADVENALRDHHPRIGACVDTGHFLRSGEDPVQAVRTFGKRLYSIHLKDVKGRTEFTEIGRGDLDTVELFRALLKLNYREIVALEYEEHPRDPGPYIDRCLTATQDAIGKAMHMR